MRREELLRLATPILERVGGLDASRPAACLAALRALDTAAFEEALRTAHAEGWATPREAGGIRFGRLARPCPDTFGLSVDVVEMAAPANAPHVHPKGEFDLSFALEGTPRFDGHAPGWLVYPPGSRHTPTVRGGRMLIVYFLPEGEITFESPRPSA